VKATLEHGLIPTVVPELEGVTIGGAVAGCSIEGMSYKHGGFHDSCLEYEVVTTLGEVLTCSRASDPLVFEMMHSSYGTLGLLSLLTFRLVPARRYVRMEYRAFDTVEAFDAELHARCEADDFDLIDGIIHGPRQFVLCLGTFIDDPPYVSRYTWQGPYYKSTATRTEDHLTTPDYCFRYDPDCHWISRAVPPLEWWPVRAVLGPFILGSTNMIRASKRLEPVMRRLQPRPDVVCDVFIPAGRFQDFVRWYDRDFVHYPLWIVPYRLGSRVPWLTDAQHERLGGDFVIDCAIYGKPNRDPHVDASKVLEDKVYELGGIKTLISRNHYSRERFWSIYNRPNWETVKRRLDPRGVLPDLERTFRTVE
jgi:FAD/FMN-containing dehydrogenase